jgi:hypothetical protein
MVQVGLVARLERLEIPEVQAMQVIRALTVTEVQVALLA